MIKTSDFPQADNLEKVGMVAEAVSEGKRTDRQIESFIGLDSQGRQGRYYRMAAEILGLIYNKSNYANLTALGEEFANLENTTERKNFLARCLIETQVFREALRYIHLNNPGNNELRLWFQSFYPGAKNTADRRFHTIINYLNDVELLESFKNTFFLRKFTGSVVKESMPINRDLTGQKIIKSNSSRKKSDLQKTIHIDIDAQQRERANNIHWRLVDGKSSFLSEQGLEPKYNEHIDLFCFNSEDLVIYEMKSINSKGTNLISQIRSAVSQLYEYRYFYNKLKAKLCIVTNYDLNKKDNWLLNYLEKDRAIAYEWTNDFYRFFSENDSSSLLGKFGS